jgi:NAD(P)-dependent dehydrogenase (short-subunit alcohol dehydrogenase family)
MKTDTPTNLHNMFTDKVIIITGSTQGIGLVTAEMLIHRGARLVINSRSHEKVEKALFYLRKITPNVIGLAGDVSNYEFCLDLRNYVMEEFGRIDILINNAGVPLRQEALQVTPAEWDIIMDTNLKGTFFLSQEVANTWVSLNTPGCIINMASLHGIVAMPGRSSYGIAKAGILQMTKMLALEWAQHNIRVNAIAPGRVETPARATTFAPDPKYREAMLNKIPLKRFCTPEQAAGAACYLASDLASIMTGQVLILDGGITTY